MDNDKLYSSIKMTEADGDCSLVFELPENDPLFEKKKKVLQAKGFDTKERVYFNSISCSSWTNTTLEKMLKRARIIHLDEVELYFGEVPVSPSVEFYSHRNELEALNSILSLIDISCSSCQHTRMDVLQELCNATLDRIQEFGDKNRLETRIVEDLSIEKEECILQWGERNDVRTKLKIAYVEGAGRGAIATEDLKVGDVALEIPMSIVISEELVHESDMFPILEKIDGISSETMLLLWSMKEKHNSNSKFKTYFNALPEAFNTGLSFEFDAIMVLAGTLLLEEIIEAKKHLNAQYEELVPALCKDHPDIFPPEFYTQEQFFWACELWYSNGMQVMFTDGKLRTCLIPIAGFLNHSLYPHIMHYGKVDSKTNSLKFCVSKPCNMGEQCYLSYGNFSSSHLVTFYGFIPQGDNLYDTIPLEIDNPLGDCPEEFHPMSDSATHMVRGTWLSNNHEIFHYGLPPPLLDHLRSAWSTVPPFKTPTLANLEVEKKVLGDILSTYETLMECIDDTEEDNRRNSSWDVKLAMEYKAIQRRIISSILTSCHSGLKTIENEMCRCAAVTSSG